MSQWFALADSKSARAHTLPAAKGSRQSERLILACGKSVDPTHISEAPAELPHCGNCEAWLRSEAYLQKSAS